MKLDDLKKSLSTLDILMDKTNSDISIDVDTCKTAQSRLLAKFRLFAIFGLIIIIAYAFLIYAGLAPSKFPANLNILLEVYLLSATVWYVFLYFWLRSINIAAISPAKLFLKTAHLKIFLISGEILFLIAFCALFLCFPSARWFLPGAMTGVILGIVFYSYPKYKEIFRDINSIK